MGPYTENGSAPIRVEGLGLHFGERIRAGVRVRVRIRVRVSVRVKG